MKAPEQENERALVAVLNNGMAVFTEKRVGALSIYCQNILTQEIFVIEESLKIEEKSGGRRVIARCSRDGNKIEILAYYQCYYFTALRMSGYVSFNNEAPQPILYTVMLNNHGTVTDVKNQICSKRSFESSISSTDSAIMFPHRFSGHSLSDYIGWDICYIPRTALGEVFARVVTGNPTRLAYLKVYDTVQRRLLIEHEITTTIFTVALSCDQTLLAMIFGRKQTYYLDAFGTGSNLRNIGDMEIYRLGQTVKKLKHQDLMSEHLKGINQEGTIISVAISDEGNVAIVLKQPAGSLYLYFYSLSQNKSYHLPVETESNLYSECRTGHFINKGRNLVFQSSQTSWSICQSMSAETFGWEFIRTVSICEFKPSFPHSAGQVPKPKVLTPVPVKVSKPPLHAKPKFVTEFKSEPVEEPKFIEYGELKEQKKLKENDTHIIYTASWGAKVVALKVIKTAGDSETNKKCLEREFNTLKAISYPRIIKTLGHSLGVSNNFCLVLHYYPHGDLGQYIYKPGEWNNPKAWRYRCVVEVCEALDYLHSQTPPLIHLDIKPENVFLDENWHAVVGDFGLAIVLPKNKTHQSTDSGGKGTVEFMAPELHQIPEDGQQNAYRPACDIYSLAFLMWCCKFQKMPFNGLGVYKIPVHVVKGGREKIPTETPKRVASLITFCWAHNFSERPRISDVLKEVKDIYKEELQNSGGIVSVPKALRK